MPGADQGFGPYHSREEQPEIVDEDVQEELVRKYVIENQDKGHDPRYPEGKPDVVMAEATAVPPHLTTIEVDLNEFPTGLPEPAPDQTSGPRLREEHEGVAPRAALRGDAGARPASGLDIALRGGSATADRPIAKAVPSRGGLDIALRS